MARNHQQMISDAEYDAYVAVVLWGETEQEYAARASISQSTVSRLVASCRRKKEETKRRHTSRETRRKSVFHFSSLSACGNNAA